MVTRKNESKTLAKHISCKCKCKFDSSKCNSNRKWNNNKYQSECKNSRQNVCEKGYICNPPKCSCKNDKYKRSITDNSMITCGEITGTIKLFWQKLFQQKAPQQKTKTRS